jgi:hypothetical protein
MQAQPLIPPTMSVSRTIRLFPATVPVFAAFGVDAFGGRQTSIAEAARRDGADPIALVGALNRVAEGSA